MIKHVFCIGIYLVCFASPFTAHYLPSIMASGNITTAYAAEGHEDKAHQQKKHAQKAHKDKARESSDKHDDADDESKNWEGSAEGKDGSGNGSGGVSPPPPTPPGTPTDITPPVIIPPANITQEATSLLSPVALGAASVSDNVSTGLRAIASPPGPYPLGVTTVIWSATDAAGNVGTATQTVSLVDTTPPVITAPAAVTANSSAGQAIAVAIGQATASDAILPVSISSNAPTVFPIGVTKVIWTATDAHGNSATTSQLVTVTAIDSTAPVVTSPASVAAEATAAITPVALGTATATDAVSGALAVSNNAPPAGFPVGVTTVTYTATDAAGNVGTATQTVSITDTTPPLISMQQPAVTVEAVAAQSSVNLGIVSANDIVDGSLTPTSNAPSAFPLGVTQVLWSATDAAGNLATATQNVVVQDTTPPLVTAPAAVTVDSATGQPTAVAIGIATAMDAFIPIIISNNAPASFPIGITTVTWTATDANGNSATVMQTVTVNDRSVLAGLPPDPGLAGQATLAGIDSDNDGVRDDVQRWIALTYPNSQKTRASLTQMTITMQQFILDAVDPAKSMMHAIQMGKDTRCLAYIQGGIFSTISSEHKAIFLNSALRSQAWLQADHQLSGSMFKGMDYADWKKGCNFDPDVMPN